MKDMTLRGTTSNRWLTTGEAALALGVSDQSIRIWHRKGLLPAERTAKGQRLFEQCDVEALRVKRDSSA